MIFNIWETVPMPNYRRNPQRPHESDAADDRPETDQTEVTNRKLQTFHEAIIKREEAASVPPERLRIPFSV